MSTAKVLALVGANGYVGKAFADAFLNIKAFELRILARAESIESAPLQEFKSSGASLHAISYDDESSITKALQGVDVLVSTVGSSAIVAQLPLVKAAKAAGVKVFFPSEYGSLFDDSTTAPIMQAKKTVLKAAKEADLPVATLATGGFPEYCFIPPLGYTFAEKKVDIWGDGNAKSNWTTVRSVADWISNVLKTIPIEQLKNKSFVIQGNLASANDVVKLWEQKHNDKLQVNFHPIKELEDRLTANPADIFATLIREWASGRGDIGNKDNGLYPEWKPDTIESIL